MKNTAIMALLGLALSAGLLPGLGQTSANAQTDVSFQVFYDQLSPYGNWVNYPDYGYVWVPGAGSDFRPYGTNGHWVYADEGWTWVSGYEWGWAPFHYGNWFYDDSYGWMWTPGYQWAPAWVTWGESGGNYCWAPVGPRVDIGVSFSSYRPPSNYWTFCPREHINSINASNYYVRNVHNTTVINNITVINNVNRGGGHAYLRGPEPTNVARYTHTTIRPVAIQTSARPGAAHVQNGRLAIYRPSVRNTNSASARPSRVQDLHALKPVRGAHPAAAGTPGNRPGGTSPANAAANNNRPGNTPGARPPNTPGTRPSNTPGSNRPQGTPGPNRPTNAPGARPDHTPGRPAQPAGNSAPVRPAPQPANRPHPVNPAPGVHPPASNTNRPPVQQHAVPQPHPMPQQHTAPAQHPMPQQHPAPQQRTMPQPAPQQRPAVQPHPMPQQHPMPAPHPAQPVNRPPAPAPHPNQGGEPEHH